LRSFAWPFFSIGGAPPGTNVWSNCLKNPLILPKGTVIEVFGTYDNSPNNPYNPDSNALVVYGEQTWNEMLGGLMDFALGPGEATPELFEAVQEPAAGVSAESSLR
jgi:hypothetical protein